MCPNYCSSRRYGARSDLFSLGIVILELLTGKIQNDNGGNLFELYVEEGGDPSHPLSRELDPRIGACPVEVATELEAIARSCLKSHRNRIRAIDALGRLVRLQRTHSRAGEERNAAVQIVRHFMCPLTLDLMIDPVVTPYGHTYEREAILAHLAISETCPLTREALTAVQLVENRVIQEAAEEFMARARADPALLAQLN